MSPSVKAALSNFIQLYLTAAESEVGELRRQPFDAGWVSPCQQGQADANGQIRWAPCLQEQPVDFSGLENALELQVHPDLKQYYGSYWSAGLEAFAEEGSVSLILLWNQQDFSRLVENLIGHALAKRASRQPFTLFFATADPDSELFLSVDNQSGQVLLEEPGSKLRRVVETDLATFINRLTPSMDRPRIY